MTTERQQQGKNRRAGLLRSLHARLEMASDDELDLFDAAVTRTERVREDHDIDLDDPSTVAEDIVLALLARDVAGQRQRVQARLAEIEAEEMPAYGGGR
jgi:hypothetical protein